LPESEPASLKAKDTMTKSNVKSISRDALTGRFRPEPSHTELRSEMRAFAVQLKKDKSQAREFLVKAGIVTPKGNLRKAYGG
jgi:hypothetical protein